MEIRPGYSIRYIDKEVVAPRIAAFSGKSLTSVPRKPKLIISLTSFPERMHDIHFCLYSLLDQTVSPDAVILWLAEEQFPNKEKNVPAQVLGLVRCGLTIRWCKDLRQYKKLIPALREFPEDVVVTADDDIFYPRDWLERLYASYLKEPAAIHCHRAHRVAWIPRDELRPYAGWQQCVRNVSPSFLNFFTGSGGVLYPPHCLDARVFDEASFNRIAFSNDDVWFWGMAVRKGTKVCVVPDNFRDLIYVNPDRELRRNGEFTLGTINNIQKENDRQLERLFEFAPSIRARLIAELKKDTGENFWRRFWPRRTFNAKWYLEQNPDVAASGMDPYEHYKRFGEAEGRRPVPQ
ncbi:MAG TPA: hypothetical protein PLL75_01000 [Candidatus Omnitrophota bacterium]|nr:hypothetical protein [Candidatus Omnitrophota bacterium]